jgi:hypothetical protein
MLRINKNLARVIFSLVDAICESKGFNPYPANVENMVSS